MKKKTKWEKMDTGLIYKTMAFTIMFGLLYVINEFFLTKNHLINQLIFIAIALAWTTAIIITIGLNWKIIIEKPYAVANKSLAHQEVEK